MYSLGILVIGGYYSQEVEFWSAVDPLGGSCKLDDYPFTGVMSDLFNIPTANCVSDQVVNCYRDFCDVFRNGEWSHLVATMVTRYQHSSAVYQDKVLLIGGMESNTTEWITLDRRVSLGPGHRIHASPVIAHLEPELELFEVDDIGNDGDEDL